MRCPQRPLSIHFVLYTTLTFVLRNVLVNELIDFNCFIAGIVCATFGVINLDDIEMFLIKNITISYNKLSHVFSIWKMHLIRHVQCYMFNFIAILCQIRCNLNVFVLIFRSSSALIRLPVSAKIRDLLYELCVLFSSLTCSSFFYNIVEQFNDVLIRF